MSAWVLVAGAEGAIQLMLGRQVAMKQLAKVASFAVGNEAAVRKSAAGDFFQ
jgi:hypothetical protein